MPPPLWHPPHGIFTYYLYEKTHNFFCKSESLYPDAPRPPMGDWWRKRGASYKKKRYSYENRSLPDLMMGVETSITPFARDAAAPKGAPRRPQLPDFLETVLAPPCPARGPEAGSAHMNWKHFTDFHGSGVNSLLMPVSPEQFFLVFFLSTGPGLFFPQVTRGSVMSTLAG